MNRLEIDVELSLGEFRLAVSESFELSGITAIFGASGSGKTTLLRVIAGLETRARGRIAVCGQEWLSPDLSLRPEARALGFVFQDGRLFPHLDVRRNLLFPIRHGGRRGPVSFEATVEALDLGALLERYPASLSGGEQQRVAIARALLADPALLLMDEPLSSLDVPRRRELLPLIKSLPMRFDLPVLYVTHDVDELTYLADRVLIMADGRSAASGGAGEILARHDFARLSDIDDPGTMLEATIESHRGELTVAALGSGRLRLPRIAGQPGARIRLRIHPRDVIIATSEPEGLSIRNTLAATIRSLETLADGLITVWMTLDDQALSARITREAADELGLAPGKPVFALIKSVALDVFGRG